MTIEKKTAGSTLTFALEGRLDTTTSPDLDRAVKTSLDGVRNLVFDLKKLEYISSAGLRVLLSIQKLMNGKGTMKICNASEAVMDIFDVTGFSDILTIEQ